MRLAVSLPMLARIILARTFFMCAAIHTAILQRAVNLARTLRSLARGMLTLFVSISKIYKIIFFHTLYKIAFL